MDAIEARWQVVDESKFRVDTCKSMMLGARPTGSTTASLEQEEEDKGVARVAMPGLHHQIQEAVSAGSIIAACVVVSGKIHS